MDRRISFTFDTDPQFDAGIKRLSDVLGFDMGGGIEITASEAADSGVSLKNGKAHIRYSRKNQFFRQLGILFEHAAEKSFESADDSHFTELSVMLDVSSGGSATVETMSKFLDRLALMGYNMAMLYTEVNIELETRPYFGYMRGRYTADELKAIDDYAFDYGIELVPCIECYGHMQRYLRWGEAAPIKDTPSVLLAREDETFVFLEELISKLDSSLRSKRIHIGMDEAWDMGRGAFLDRHGYVPNEVIFGEFMERLTSIVDKYSLTPMMWSDMYFRISSGCEKYYEEDTEVPEELAKTIPENMELVFWHYGEQPGCDDYMLKKHKALNRDVIYAGGNWSWSGHFPEHNYTRESVDFSLKACRNNDVRKAMLTLWLTEGDLFASLYDLSYFAEQCYDACADEAKHAARFAVTCSGNWDAFYTMSLYHNYFENEEFPNFNDRFFGKAIFYQDLMQGTFDSLLWERPMSAHYAECCEKMSAYTGGTWDYMYDYARQIFSYLALKSKIHETLVPSYKAGDMDALRNIADNMIPELKNLTVSIHNAHRKIWHKNLKPFGWRMMEDRYAGMTARCDTALIVLSEYLNGESTCLPQLDEPRLHCPLSGFASYDKFVV